MGFILQGNQISTRHLLQYSSYEPRSLLLLEKFAEQQMISIRPSTRMSTRLLDKVLKFLNILKNKKQRIYCSTLAWHPGPLYYSLNLYTRQCKRSEAHNLK